MIAEIVRKIFGLVPPVCDTCAVLRDQLERSELERRELLSRLLDRNKPESPIQEVKEELKPITPKYVPWRVRQQMLEAEDRRTAAIAKERDKQIEELEKELNIRREENANATSVSESISSEEKEQDTHREGIA